MLQGIGCYMLQDTVRYRVLAATCYRTLYVTGHFIATYYRTLYVTGY